MGRVNGPPLKRFWAKVNKHTLTGCWEWQGAKHPDGHGRFWIEGETVVYAHRYSYEIHKGPVPEGLYACHHCDNAGCVNPEHLYPGTPKDNSHDAMRRGRLSRRGGSRIDEITRQKIMELHRMGLSSGRIAEGVGASVKTVQKYIRLSESEFSK